MILHPQTRPEQSRRRSAFTLLEVLIVVAIIVILASVGGTMAFRAYEDAKVSRAKIDCESLSGAVENYKLNNGDYPASIDVLAAPQPNGMSALVPPDKTRDPWGKPFQYQFPGQHNGARNKPDIFTTAPDGTVIGNFN